MTLEQLCAACGIATYYTDIRGVRHEVDPEVLLALVAEFDVDTDVSTGAPSPAPARNAAPERCYLPPALAAGGRTWGFAVQLYALRSERNWGIGDFGDLARLIELAARLGAGVVAVNPLHELFLDDPARASPYSPSSRLRLNALYLDVEAIGEFEECEAAQRRVRSAEFQARLARLRAAPLVDYPGVAAAKLEILRLLHAQRGRDGDDFHAYLQRQAEQQLARASERCRTLGLAVGLCLDLAVSADRNGAEVRANQDNYARKASVGAPPDDFNPLGQDWGMPPPRPDRQRAQGYRDFIELLRANMRHAGALRIDHVMGLMRLYWIPHGRTAREGAYVHYALEDLLAIVARESVRNHCLVIGEDLGTVPDEVRAALARYGVLSYRLLYFERNADGGFKLPAEYPRDALVAVSTHDLPTLAGWWAGRDSLERERLLHALRESGLPARGDLAEDVHAFLAATPSRVMMVQLEDVLGVTEQANVPGTPDQPPNWRRKLPETLENLATSERLRGLAARLISRSSSRPAHPGKPCAGPPTRPG